jgi:hypothetical protein
MKGVLRNIPKDLINKWCKEETKKNYKEHITNEQ